MTFFRCVYKITAILVWFLFILVRTAPQRFRGWRGRRQISHLARILMKGIAKIINLRVKVYGDIREIPSALVVSNHMGYVDIIAHGTVFPLRYASTAEIASLPVVGWIVGSSHPVWIDRKSKPASRKALRDFAKTMKRGMYLIVYPEGTSTDGKSGILPFKSTSFEAAVAGNLPVIPVVTRYREVPGRPTVCWYGDMTLFPHLWHVLGLPSIEAELHILPPVFPDGRSRKEMAAYTHGLMENAYNDINRAYR